MDAGCPYLFLTMCVWLGPLGQGLMHVAFLQRCPGKSHAECQNWLRNTGECLTPLVLNPPGSWKSLSARVTIEVAQGLPGVQKKGQESVGISNRLLTPCHTRLQRPPRGLSANGGLGTHQEPLHWKLKIILDTTRRFAKTILWKESTGKIKEKNWKSLTRPGALLKPLSGKKTLEN